MSVLFSLRYPTGKHVEPEVFSVADRAAAIATLAAFPQQLVDALHGLNDAQLDTPYRPAGWTIRQLVHHVADSHVSAYLATRQALTADWPVVVGYDPDAWAELPDAREMPVEASLRILEGVQRRWVAIMRGVPEVDWAGRGYMHSEGGRCALERVPLMYAWHARHHLAHVVNCRARMDMGLT